MRGLPLALGLLAAVPAEAWAEGPPPPVPWEITGTSTAPVAEPAVAYRVERRFFEKTERFVVKSGFSYLSRGDFYENPGISLDFSWYPLEFVAIDFVSATMFFSQLGSTATSLRETFGILPDSQKPLARITAGGRFAFAYGKVLIEEVGAVVHLDASIGLHLGALVTEDAVNFGGDIGLAFQAAVFSRFLVWLDVSWFGSHEARTSSSFSSGPIGTIGVGLVL